jgi:2-polyprenyl-3-methyl-5-hydroxy-6-metoxy-1,4-benzoquinol methylase
VLAAFTTDRQQPAIAHPQNEGSAGDAADPVSPLRIHGNGVWAVLRRQGLNTRVEWLSVVTSHAAAQLTQTRGSSVAIAGPTSQSLRDWATARTPLRSHRMPELSAPTELLESAQRSVDETVNVRRPAQVLDAGSGLRAVVSFAPHVTVVGVDSSQTLLERNERLDVRIVADLETWRPTTHFDCVLCWDVLEHLRDPRGAVRRFAAAVRPGGIMIIGSPNPRSLKGIITRWTPHWFHEFTYRRLFEIEPAGEGTTPFPTFMRPDVAAQRVVETAESAGLELLTLAYTESPMQMKVRRRVRLDGRMWRLVCGFVRVVTAARVDAAATDYVAIFRRSPPS